MSDVLPIKNKSLASQFDDIYHDLGTAIGDAKAVSNLLSVADTDSNICDTNAAGFAQERMLERAEEILSKLWKFKFQLK